MLCLYYSKRMQNEEIIFKAKIAGMQINYIYIHQQYKHVREEKSDEC